jgi:hypothetical protein
MSFCQVDKAIYWLLKSFTFSLVDNCPSSFSKALNVLVSVRKLLYFSAILGVCFAGI